MFQLFNLRPSFKVRYDDADAQLVTGEEMVKHLWEQAEACVATVNAARRAV